MVFLVVVVGVGLMVVGAVVAVAVVEIADFDVVEKVLVLTILYLLDCSVDVMLRLIAFVDLVDCCFRKDWQRNSYCKSNV